MHIRITAYDANGEPVSSRDIDDASVNTHYWLNSVNDATRVTVVVLKSDEEPSITCPTCGSVSYNKNDIREKYCGRCNQYHHLMNFEDLTNRKVPPTPPIEDNKSLGEYFDETPPTEKTN